MIELMVKPGDTVQVDQSLLTVESDKTSMKIPSSQAGVVKELKVKLGNKVKQGSVVLLLESAAGGNSVSNGAVATVDSAQEAIKTVATAAQQALACAASKMAAPVAASLAAS